MATTVRNDYERYLGAVMHSVAFELRRQDKKWGDPQHHPDYWFAITAEEFGEVARAVVERDSEAAHDEIVQTIACLMRLLSAMAADAHDRQLRGEL